jgi:hypothetical protein
MNKCFWNYIAAFGGVFVSGCSQQNHPLFFIDPKFTVCISSFEFCPFCGKKIDDFEKLREAINLLPDFTRKEKKDGKRKTCIA